MKMTSISNAIGCSRLAILPSESNEGDEPLRAAGFRGTPLALAKLTPAPLALIGLARRVPRIHPAR